jgi:hypothetical protein
MAGSQNRDIVAISVIKNSNRRSGSYRILCRCILQAGGPVKISLSREIREVDNASSVFVNL